MHRLLGEENRASLPPNLCVVKPLKYAKNKRAGLPSSVTFSERKTRHSLSHHPIIPLKIDFLPRKRVQKELLQLIPRGHTGRGQDGTVGPLLALGLARQAKNSLSYFDGNPHA